MKDVPSGINAPTKDQIEGRVKGNVDVAQQKHELPPMFDPAPGEEKREPAVKTVKFP